MKAMIQIGPMKQTTLFSLNSKSDFGGSLLSGRRKTARPLGLKKSNHLVLKTKIPFLLLRNKKLVRDVLHQFGQKFGVKILSHAVHSDHIHISFKTQNRDAYKKWIRATASVLVQKIKGLRFSLRPWSRIVEWGRSFKAVQAYILGNQIEADFVLRSLQRVDSFYLQVLNALKPH